MLNLHRPATRTRRPPSQISRESHSFGRKRSSTANSTGGETAFPEHSGSPSTARGLQSILGTSPLLERQLSPIPRRHESGWQFSAKNSGGSPKALSLAHTRQDGMATTRGQQNWTPGRQQQQQQQRVQPTQLGLGMRPGLGNGAARKRSMTVHAAKVGFVEADPAMPVDECTKRIDQLLERVQNSHRYYEAHVAMKSPTVVAATRFDSSGPTASGRPGRQRESTSTVSTLSLEGSGQSGESVGEPYGVGRRRAATMDHGVRSKVSSTLVDSQGVRQEERPVQHAPPPPRRTTTAEVRMKLEKLRARRAARMETAEGSECGSPLVGEGPKQSEQHDFFDDQEVVALFQEIPVPLKDAEWDKRVYYYHVAQTNAQFRAATEEAAVGDYRRECLVDLLGEHVTEKVIGMDQWSGSETVEDDEVDRIAAWMDEDEDDGGANAYRSFDWSRDGFGYMEFRRQSKASLVGSSAMSPGDSRRDLPALAARDRVASPPSISRRAYQQQQQQQRSTTPDIDFPMDLPGMSMMGADSGSGAHVLSPMATTNAMARFGEAIPTAQRQKGARPTTVYGDGMFDNLDCDGLDGAQDDEWEAMVGDDKESKQSRIGQLDKENEQLREEIRMARQAIAALTRVVLKHRQ